MGLIDPELARRFAEKFGNFSLDAALTVLTTYPDWLIEDALGNPHYSYGVLDAIVRNAGWLRVQNATNLQELINRRTQMEEMLGQYYNSRFAYTGSIVNTYADVDVAVAGGNLLRRTYEGIEADDGGTLTHNPQFALKFEKLAKRLGAIHPDFFHATSSTRPLDLQWALVLFGYYALNPAYVTTGHAGGAAQDIAVKSSHYAQWLVNEVNWEVAKKHDGSYLTLTQMIESGLVRNGVMVQMLATIQADEELVHLDESHIWSGLEVVDYNTDDETLRHVWAAIGEANNLKAGDKVFLPNPVIHIGDPQAYQFS